MYFLWETQNIDGFNINNERLGSVLSFQNEIYLNKYLLGKRQENACNVAKPFDCLSSMANVNWVFCIFEIYLLVLIQNSSINIVEST